MRPGGCRSPWWPGRRGPPDAAIARELACGGCEGLVHGPQHPGTRTGDARPAGDHRGDRRADRRRRGPGARGGPRRSYRGYEAEVEALAASASRPKSRCRLDILVNDIWGGDRYMQWDKPLWEHDWQGGLRMLQMGVHTHLITCRAAIPLMLRTAASHGTRGLVVEMTDGTSAGQRRVPPQRRLLLRPGEGQRRADRDRTGRRT